MKVFCYSSETVGNESLQSRPPSCQMFELLLITVKEKSQRKLNPGTCLDKHLRFSSHPHLDPEITCGVC